MKVVLDTNVIVSGLLSPYSHPGEIIRMVSSGHLNLFLDARLFAEYSEVLLRPKFQFTADLVSDFLEYVEHMGIFVPGTPLAASLPDPDDEPFLEVALAGPAECLITGNLKHFPVKMTEGIPVLSPVQFLAYYRKQRKKTFR